MRMKKLMVASVSLLLAFSLVACTPKKESTEPTEPVQSRQITAKHSDTRLAFNKIVLAKADDEFKGGTNLATLKELFGEPKSHEEVPAGDVTLDSYKWQFDQMEIGVQLYEDSAIVRSISHFSFIRENTISLADFNTIKEGMTFTQAVDLLGEPDVFSQAVSSDKEQLQAIWSSGLKTNNHAQIDLLFENNKLISFNQIGLID